MGINGVSGTMHYQSMQVAAQKSSEQNLRQLQAAQGPAEEGKEGAVEKTKEASAGSESSEAKSINLYA